MEVLSQSQIDDLLNSLTSGAMDLDAAQEDASGKKVKDYDFRTPKRFTKEQLKIISSVYENFSRLLSSYLTSALRLFVEVEFKNVEELRYSEFNNALPDSVMTTIGEMRFSGSGDENNTIMMDLSRPICFSIIDRLLGGPGEGVEMERDFTEIELTLLENICKGAFPQMSDAWLSYFELDAVYRRVETNSRLMQAIAADETVVIVMLDVAIREVQGTVSICIPAACLEDIIKKINSQYMRNLRRINSAGDKERRELVMQYLQDSNLELRCVIGRTSVTVSDVIYLSPGDVLQLGKPVDTPVELSVGDSCWFRGKMGTYRNKKAVRISEVL